MNIETLCASYEIIFVDDGSDDGTVDAVLKERTLDPRIKLLHLSRNFGHQEAVSAGIEFASGAAVIVMDADLQHPPEVLPHLIRLWRSGYEVIRTVRLTTEDAGFLKRLYSHSFYFLINRISGLKLQDGSADFRLMDRVAVDALREMPERSRFLRGMVQWIGFRQTSVPYHAASRRAGLSKYSFTRQLRFAVTAIISFSAAPLYLVSLLGLILASTSFLYGVYAILAKLLTHATIVGWASVLAGVMFIGGVQLLSLGLAGAYIAKIYEEVKGRPVYLIREAHGFRVRTRTPTRAARARRTGRRTAIGS